MDQFILFGDSITQQSFSPHVSFAFGAVLSDAYARKLDIVNRGLSGYCSTQAIRALSLCIPDPKHAKVRFLLLWFGANDARIEGSPGGPSQTVSVEDYTSNLRHMVQHPGVRAHPGVRIILATPPPIDERMCLKSDQEKYPTLGRILRRTAVNTATYAQAVRDLGAELQVPVLDVHTTMLINSGYHPTSTLPIPGSMEAPLNTMLQSYLADGLHFSGEGYRVLYGELMALIARVWPDQMPSELGMRLPAWDAQTAWRKNEEGNHAWEEEGGFVVSGKFEAVVEGMQPAKVQ